MTSLVKIMLTLAIFFASTFVVLKSTGLVTVSKVEAWFEMAKSVDAIYVCVVIVLLLFADLFIAIPTLTVMLLAGFFLGPLVGSISAVLGLSLAGACGYGLSRRYGHFLLSFLVNDQQKQIDAVNMFQQHGAVVILLSRATPILPEVSACMAGMTKMPFMKFCILWLVSTVPYAVIACYAGSISSVENPKPAIFTAIGLTALFWSGWFVFSKVTKAKRQLLT